MIEGKTFVLTGFMGRNEIELEDYIYDNMGEYSDNVTSNTEALIAWNVANVTEKMLQAQTLGVAVYTIIEFKKRYEVILTLPEKEQSDDE